MRKSVKESSPSQSMPRVVVEYPVGDQTPNVFVGTARMRGSNATKVLKDFIAQYLAGETPGIQETGPPPAEEGTMDDESYNLCSMVRACVEAGDPWATQIRGVVMAIYEKMRRES